ncbi:patatin-like phospholipase family protein [Sulfobacillus harzensis]|uniref:Patatin-like phospholipase family protein n=1 Tax=Sulfobacillus harzensis TaxID=2729629 RepID=A0A7Y0L1B5_9FIRM|nr:patatin-like phospholipase family protein [Sulfobacillus harzensis]NMP21187.1 patatin-like phospholipase family protein [Sulfobacillus harzensis]
MKRLSLALSGGGLLGAAHLGALHFLEERGVRAQAVAGTSAGGLVASLYALGVAMDPVIQVGQEVADHPTDYFDLNWRGLVDEWIRSLGPPTTGLIDPQKFIHALLNLAPTAHNTDDWRIPTVLTAVDLVQLESVAFTNRPDGGHPAHGHWRIAAHQPLTLAMPGLYAAPRLDHALLVDGGVADTLPVDWAAALVPDLVVAINVAAPAPAPAAEIGILEALSRSEAYAVTAKYKISNNDNNTSPKRPT